MDHSNLHFLDISKLKKFLAEKSPFNTRENKENQPATDNRKVSDEQKVNKEKKEALKKISKTSEKAVEKKAFSAPKPSNPETSASQILATDKKASEEDPVETTSSMSYSIATESITCANASAPATSTSSQSSPHVAASEVDEPPAVTSSAKPPLTVSASRPSGLSAPKKAFRPPGAKFAPPQAAKKDAAGDAEGKLKFIKLNLIV